MPTTHNTTPMLRKKGQVKGSVPLHVLDMGHQPEGVSMRPPSNQRSGMAAEP